MLLLNPSNQHLLRATQACFQLQKAIFAVPQAALSIRKKGPAYTDS